MKVLIIGNFHHKNKEGLERMLHLLKYDYKYGTINDIPQYDLIYSPTNPINTSIYPTKKFIFGPHFSVFPTNKLLQINNIHKNSIYIQPSEWAAKCWINFNANSILPIKTFSFPVNTDKFKSNNIKNKEQVFIYFKRRNPHELEYIKTNLQNKNISYKVFDYVKQYNEDEYLNYLQNSKYGIILDAHESQGFAIEEALSCNVPLLVWNVTSMRQEYGSRYKDIFATSIPYWDKRCGEFFYKQEDFEQTFEKFISKLNTYKPREYIMEILNVKKCGIVFEKLI
jgi:hypothetical protein